MRVERAIAVLRKFYFLFLLIPLNLTRARIIMRAFIFSVWVHVGKNSTATIKALETLAGKQFTTAEQGGRYVVSATVQNKSFTYELPGDQTGAGFLEMVRESWRMISIGGATGDEMTDAELKAYLLDTDGEVTSRTVASFTQYAR